MEWASDKGDTEDNALITLFILWNVELPHCAAPRRMSLLSTTFTEANDGSVAVARPKGAGPPGAAHNFELLASNDVKRHRARHESTE
jgi:hypothetical protein